MVQGDERYRTGFATTYYKGAHAILVLFDLSNAQSMQQLESLWLPEIAQYAEKNVQVVVAANKCDLRQEKQQNLISQETLAVLGKHFASVPIFEISAKTSHNVNKCFETLIAHTMKRQAKAELYDDQVPTFDTVTTTTSTPKEKSSNVQEQSQGCAYKSKSHEDE